MTSEIAADSLTLLRLPSALAAGVTVWLTGLLARELGGSRRAEAVAAVCAAVASIVLFTGHLLSTSTFDLLAWTAVTWLAVRAVRSGDDRLWLVAGLPGARPPRRRGDRRSAAPAGQSIRVGGRGARARALVALAALARQITAGPSSRSRARSPRVPFQALLVSPPPAPVWIAGLVRLLRDAAMRDLRFLAWAWLVLAGVFMSRPSRGLPDADRAVIVTGNCGQAGAIDRFGPALGLTGHAGDGLRRPATSMERAVAVPSPPGLTIGRQPVDSSSPPPPSP